MISWMTRYFKRMIFRDEKFFTVDKFFSKKWSRYIKINRGYQTGIQNQTLFLSDFSWSKPLDFYCWDAIEKKEKNTIHTNVDLVKAVISRE